MRSPILTLNAAMTGSEALRRLAKHGYWSDPEIPAVRDWLEAYATRMRRLAAERSEREGPHEQSAEEAGRPDPATMTVEDAARLLQRPVDENAWVAVRRQDGVTLFWYSRPVQVVLQMLEQFPHDWSMVDILGLHEHESEPTVQDTQLGLDGGEAVEGIVLRDGTPVAIGDGAPFPSLERRDEAVRGGGPERYSDEDRSAPRAPAPSSWEEAEPEEQAEPEWQAEPEYEETGSGAEDEERVGTVEVRAHPYLDAPRTVVAEEEFTVAVGLTEQAMPEVRSTGPIEFRAPLGGTVLVEVHLVAEGFEARDGWRLILAVEADDPTAARVEFHLTPRTQDELVRLSSLLVHFSVDGVVRGSAARHIVVEQFAGAAPSPDERGLSWLDAESGPPNLVLRPDAEAPDMEVDIAKPDGNAATGSYRCVLRNAHGVPVPDEPLPIELGEDAQTFAKTHIDGIRAWSGNDLVDNLLESTGDIIADQLPPAFWAVLRAVADRVDGRPVTLQFNSAEPYVPWELALVDPPIDPARPTYLAAQVAMARWILGNSKVAAPPRKTVAVKAMAVMAGMYQLSSGLKALPEAIEEAKELAKTYKKIPAVPLDCTPDNLKSLLDASIRYNFDHVGGVQAVHFAGHGEVDPHRPGDAALFLNNGEALNPRFFRRSTLGREHAPFLFLNACMVGTGGELLGDYGGFPGHCLSGGFTGLVGPLWAVDDKAAKSVALAFYKEALADGRSVAEVLRDLRAHYKPDDPAPSFLAYVYYGNPHLKLTPANAPSPSAASAP